jgi:predicted HicB family RNase H-like nuclease
VLVITALVSYEAQTVAQLNHAFKQAVEDYLGTCHSLGYVPEVSVDHSSL